MYVEQLRWLPAIPCPKPIHLPPTHFAFLKEGVFLAKMINLYPYNQNNAILFVKIYRRDGVFFHFKEI
ncbi:hypothetical protein B5P42_30640 [Bacillus sp. SRB_331]|nr:hypothetical protein B5P42_30640 [Bacillus sp. SRB_331]